MPLLFTVPQFAFVAPPVVDPTDLGGEDVSMRGGELVVTPAGDWATVTHELAARQSVEREAGASPGDVPRRPDWGFGLRDSLMRNATREVRDRQQTTVRRRLASNPRIGRVRDVKVESRTDVAAGTATVVTIAADVAGKAFTFTAAVTPKKGT